MTEPTASAPPTSPAPAAAAPTPASVPESVLPPTVAVTALHLAIIAALAAVVFFFQLGQADFRDDIDAVQGQIVTDIIDGRGWILPARSQVILPKKPMLPPWIGALSARLRGSNADLFDARVPSALLALVCVLSVYGFARRAATANVGLWAVLILMATPQFVVEARDSRVDMVFATLVTCALFAGWQAGQQEERRASALLTGLCVALAILTKGPLGMVLVVLVLGLSGILAGPLPGWRTLLSPGPLAVALVLPALWYVAATVEHGWTFIRVHFLDENVSRLIGGQDRSPLWYYIGPFIAQGLPWVLVLPFVARDDSALPPRTRRFLWIWVLAMFAFFTLSLGKRRAYLLPLRPALALLTAGWMVGRLRRYPEQASGAGPWPAPLAHRIAGGVTLAALLAALALRWGIGGFGASAEEYSYFWRLYLQQSFVAVCLFILAVGVGLDLSISWVHHRRYQAAAALSASLLALGMGFAVAADAVARGQASSFRPFARQVAELIRADEPLRLLEVGEYRGTALQFHLRRGSGMVTAVQDAPACTAPGEGPYLVSEVWWNQQGCSKDPRWHEITRGGPPVNSQYARRLVLARFTPGPH